MSHLSGDDDVTPLLYCERPEWEDVTPVSQYEAVNSPIAPIFYTPECKYLAKTTLHLGIVARIAYSLSQTRMQQTTLGALSRQERRASECSNSQRG